MMAALLACISLYGWGGISIRILRHPDPGWATRIAIGVAAVIFIGGVLNLLRIGQGGVLDSLGLIGLITAPLFRGKATATDTEGCRRIYFLLVFSVILGAVAAVAATQFPPTAFNYHDDFNKYFAHPVRMLQTGTLFGSPLSALGSETLGGQAVLQSFVLNHFSIEHIYAVDSMFGLMLCLFLAVSLVPPRPAFLFPALILIFFVLVVNPLMINVSSIYIGAALVMAGMQVYHQTAAETRSDYGGWGHASIIGLLYAALIALKTSFAGYVLLQLAVYAALSCCWEKGRKNRLVFCGRVAAWMLVFIAPWFLLHLPHYAGVAAGRILPQADVAAGEPYTQYIGLFSFDPSYYGPGYGQYTLLAITAAALGVACLVKGRPTGRPEPIRLVALASCGLAAGIFYVALILGGPYLNGYDVSLRLAIPVLIAVVPVIACVVSLRQYERDGARNRGRTATVAVALAVLLLNSAFASDAVRRFMQGVESGNVLAFEAFATSDPYLAYNSGVLYGSFGNRMRSAQQLIPSGTPFFAWVSAPFLFDYARNRIYDAEQAGIGNPWSYLPDVEYYMYEYAGYAVPSLTMHLEDLRFPGRHERFVTRKVLALMGVLERMREGAEILYDDGGMVVFRAHANGRRGI